MNNKYNLDDFIKIYNMFYEHDILKQVKEDLEFNKQQIKHKEDIHSKILNLQSNKFNCSPSEKEKIDKQIKTLKLLNQSYVLDTHSYEEKKDKLYENIERLKLVLEEIIYYLVCLEEE